MKLLNQTREMYACYTTKANSSKTKRNILFNMSFETFKALKMQKVCQYSGIPFDDSFNNKFSFERIDNNIGYIDGNVIAVNRYYNSLRSSHTIESLAEKINKSQALLQELKHKTLPKAKLNKKPYVKCAKKYTKLVTDLNKYGIKLNTLNPTSKEYKHILNARNQAYANLKLLIDHSPRRTTKKLRPNKFAELKNAEAIKTHKNDMLKLEAEIKDYKLIFVSLYAFTNLNDHGKKCVQHGYPLDTPKHKIDIIDEYKNANVYNWDQKS